MLQIVVYSRRSEHREFRIDRRTQPRVRGAQRALDTATTPRRAREDEAEIAGALRQRHQQLIRLRRDPDVVDVRHPRAASRPSTRREHAAPRDRNHHDAGGARLAAPGRRRLRPARAAAAAPRAEIGARDRRSRDDEAQRARAQAADRPRGDFEDEHAVGRFTRHSAWIGPWRRPIAAAARADRLDDRPWRPPAPIDGVT